ncbi:MULTISPECIES: hypothetical protein [Brevibacillus]|uniref:Uncharacterized protein n=1 Tax=Brevibacillus centrosporus TaxID=54910 RepID=A0A1I3V1N4_9BACL|nr:MULTISPECIES: hypothetical protein [Brevibacillus]MDR7315147.1 hypothetical protein [Brevibacillus nitrificans]MEC2127432.1 hypothetical protein [Brevibacillus centrosporus]MED4907317.1 hypothetical protein [Brevibacillus centrosporus]RNB67937.1 hypothetical protein EDM55_18655 [Brevibacillus centrosporus]SFJ89145.1 hypothetical protein SAMN05518846_106197 [Brevibacillus centrosporus]
MEVVDQERKGITTNGTEFSVAVYRPTKKILPAERVSFSDDHTAILKEILQGQGEIAAGTEKSKAKSTGLIQSIKDYFHK